MNDHLSPWDSCEIRYRVRHADADEIRFCDELPADWSVSDIERVSRDAGGNGFWLVFDVQGEPLESDGAIVRRILQRMGVL